VFVCGDLGQTCCHAVPPMRPVLSALTGKTLKPYTVCLALPVPIPYLWWRGGRGWWGWRLVFWWWCV
jgi:hypothetical protein